MGNFPDRGSGAGSAVPAADADPHVEPAVYLTRDIPGVGGRIKDRPEDFIVEELPLYEPQGSGEHLYLFVEKRNLPAVQLLQILSRHFRVPRTAIGYAGLKDKVAVTRQLISIHLPKRTIEDFPALTHEKVTILWSDRHANKLRQGHLKGNRFIIYIRGADLAATVRAHRILLRLAELGVPNRAGEQRFGHLLNNHLVGRALIRADWPALLDELLGPSARFPGQQAEPRRLYAEGRYADALDAFPRSAQTEAAVLAALTRSATPERAAAAIDPMQRRYYITAFQSAVFNAVLDRRLLDGALAMLHPGDLAWKHDNGAVFAVDEATIAGDPGVDEEGNPRAALSDRLRRLEISPSGPMWGLAMMQASGPTGETERRALASFGVSLDDLHSCGDRFRDPVAGDRRPLRVPLLFPDVEGGADGNGPYIRCAFELPKGAFATVVMREIMKPELTGAAAVHDDDP